MKPLKLAVVFDQKIEAGGGYQQALNAALLVKAVSSDIAEPIFFSTIEQNIPTLREYDINALYLHVSAVDKALLRIRRWCGRSFLMRWIKSWRPVNRFEAVFYAHSVDLVYFLSPDGRYRDLEKLNFIATVWDLCHRDDPEFPEVRWDGQIELRDENYRYFLPRAASIFVDSEVSRVNLFHRYGLDMDRIQVLPFEASVATQKRVDARTNFTDDVLDIKIKYDLTVPYVFYPAQFWAHKNHVYVLLGLAHLKEKYGLNVGAIFVGADKGNLSYVKECVDALGLTDVIRFGGFVSNEEIPLLYEQSLALVMPTYFGPTNLPPLEAFHLGVPVLYSDKPGLREQVGEAALLLDLTSPTCLADHLFSLINNPCLKMELVEKGFRQLELSSKDLRVSILKCVLTEFQSRRICWK